MNIHGSNELVQDVQKAGLCVGCGGCVSLCPYFANHRGKTAQFFACNLEQGRCHAYCPKAEVDYDALAVSRGKETYSGNPLGEYLEIMVAKAGENAPLGRFQAGGTVSALMAFALKEGIIEGAVLTGRQGDMAEPVLARSPEEVAACAGSKYMAAPTLAAFNKAAGQGATKLGVVGTPCQVTSLAQMRTNPLSRTDFNDPAALVVGLFCTWNLDARGLMPLLKQCAGSACVMGMDVPPPPAEIMVINTDQGRAEIPLADLRPLIPAGCRICPDMTSEFADISVGALEGTPELNTLIVRTPRGKDLVDRARRVRMLITSDLPQEALSGLKLAASNKKKRGLEEAEREGLLNTSEEGKRAALRINAKAVAEIKGR